VPQRQIFDKSRNSELNRTAARSKRNAGPDTVSLPHDRLMPGNSPFLDAGQFNLTLAA